jgi:hypothetical protein
MTMVIEKKIQLAEGADADLTTDLIMKLDALVLALSLADGQVTTAATAAGRNVAVQSAATERQERLARVEAQRQALACHRQQTEDLGKLGMKALLNPKLMLAQFPIIGNHSRPLTDFELQSLAEGSGAQALMGGKTHNLMASPRGRLCVNWEAAQKVGVESGQMLLLQCDCSDNGAVSGDAGSGGGKRSRHTGVLLQDLSKLDYYYRDKTREFMPGSERPRAVLSKAIPNAGGAQASNGLASVQFASLPLTILKLAGTPSPSVCSGDHIAIQLGRNFLHVNGTLLSITLRFEPLPAGLGGLKMEPEAGLTDQAKFSVQCGPRGAKLMAGVPFTLSSRKHPRFVLGIDKRHHYTARQSSSYNLALVDPTQRRKWFEVAQFKALIVKSEAVEGQQGAPIMYYAEDFKHYGRSEPTGLGVVMW